MSAYQCGLQTSLPVKYNVWNLPSMDIIDDCMYLAIKLDTLTFAPNITADKGSLNHFSFYI